MEENQPVKNKSRFSGSVAQAIIFAGLIIAGAIFLSRNPGSSAPKSPDKLDLVTKIDQSDFSRGSENAKVTIIEYADFSCHFCAQFHPTLKQIMTEYDGKVRWVFRHLPIFNINAAVASDCVGKISGNDTFWTFADNLYANQSSLNDDYYRNEAISLGISAEKYDACFADPILRSKISKDFSQNKLLFDFRATPYNIIVDKEGRTFSFPGALPYNDLKSIIDRLLSE